MRALTLAAAIVVVCVFPAVLLAVVSYVLRVWHVRHDPIARALAERVAANRAAYAAARRRAERGTP